jgi:hypothetical protein
MYIQLQYWRVDEMLLPHVLPNPHITHAGVQGGALTFQELRRDWAAAKQQRTISSLSVLTRQQHSSTTKKSPKLVAARP